MADLSQFAPTAEGIARLLHPFAEVVLHDIEENRIVSIHNNLSKRSAGDESLIRDREPLEHGTDLYGPFRKHDPPQLWIKYVTIKLKDDSGRAIGLMCANLDLTVVAGLKQPMLALLAPGEDSSAFELLFDDDWQERITAFVQEHLQRLNLSLESLTRRERGQLVREPGSRDEPD